MKNYWKQKLISENEELKNIWGMLIHGWKKEGEDRENLYRFRVPLNIMAFLCRRMMERTYIAHKENKKFPNKYKELEVRILKGGCARQSFYKNIESMQYSDTFRNKIEIYEEFYEICNYIIHENGSVCVDDLVSYDGKGDRLMKLIEDASFYYQVGTHNLRKRFNCSQSISWFIQWSDEKPGEVFIDIKSLMRAFEKFIKLYD